MDELARRFRTRISPHIRKHAAGLAEADANAILRQFTPDIIELAEVPGFTDDPLREEDADIHPFPDVVHKYRSKILYLTTDECPVYCRYCTRKRKTLLSQGHDRSDLEAIAAYLQARPEVREVIFSGGDPLMLAPADFAVRARAFLAVSSIRFLRVHTRAVTTAPGLLSAKFADMLAEIRRDFPEKGIAFVLHVNTAAELSAAAREKIGVLRTLDIPLYSQSVLLRSINDRAEILSDLCSALLSAGVQPYYLHQLDQVTGAAHFEVPDDEARDIYRQLKMLVPPYMLPRFVRDSKQGKYEM
jgi:KamA family protein